MCHASTREKSEKILFAEQMSNELMWYYCPRNFQTCWYMSQLDEKYVSNRNCTSIISGKRIYRRTNVLLYLVSLNFILTEIIVSKQIKQIRLDCKKKILISWQFGKMKQ